MKFGEEPVKGAEGAILAHSLRFGALRFKKGRVLGADDIAALKAAGVEAVTVARLEDDDLGEDQAAALIAEAMAPDPGVLHLTSTAPFTGRVNFHAAVDGLLMVDGDLVARINAVDEAITLATLADKSLVSARQLAATIKIIPYAAPAAAVSEVAEMLAAAPLMQVAPRVVAEADLILTRTEGMKEALLDKGADVIRTRMIRLGAVIASEQRVSHETSAVASAIARTKSPLVLILGGSATSDRRDVAPSAVEAAGGRIDRFGMPVDPGNLLFIGHAPGPVGKRPVVGLPGCARSPKLNGADWVLERLVCGVPVSAGDIADMGVGGLLKEIPSRPEPRAGAASTGKRPRVVAIVLAAGASSRMRGRDKLLEAVEGQPILRRIALAALESRADEVIVVMPPEAAARRSALAELPVSIVENPVAEEGMGSSIRTGTAAAIAKADALILLPADLPDMTPAHLDAVIAAFDPEESREICRAVNQSGRPGHPVLFGKRFFESLARAEGDEGARALVSEHGDYLVDVPTPGEGATLDLDTPEQWADWRAITEPGGP